MKYYDWISLLKQVSIIATGFFAVTGLLVDFKKNGKITGWGITVLIGLIISIPISITTQILETKEEFRKANDNAVTNKKYADYFAKIIEANKVLNEQTAYNNKKVDILKDSLINTLSSTKKELLKEQERNRIQTLKNNNPLEPFSILYELEYSLTNEKNKNYYDLFKKEIKKRVNYEGIYLTTFYFCSDNNETEESHFLNLIRLEGKFLKDNNLNDIINTDRTTFKIYPKNNENDYILIGSVANEDAMIYKKTFSKSSSDYKYNQRVYVVLDTLKNNFKKLVLCENPILENSGRIKLSIIDLNERMINPLMDSFYKNIYIKGLVFFFKDVPLTKESISDLSRYFEPVKRTRKENEEFLKLFEMKPIKFKNNEPQKIEKSNLGITIK